MRLATPAVKQIYRVSGLLALGLVLASCSDSKVSQCSKLIEIANQAVTGVKAVSENPNPDNINSMNKIADVANTAKASMQELSLSDPQLRDYQTRFVAMYTDTNQATRDLVTAAEAKNAQSAQQAFESLKTATAQEGPLVTAVNDYCKVQPVTTESPLEAPAASPSVSPTASPTP
ncbi:MAG: hypothetical protein KME07_23475 [Pegethrix bostrychoides GSE-TBD4-15B]|jgi:hypothetical protein|uniref:Uncharacterized protein n=1 Tax=Pegethrix bostrychoides GSE-TBD4-15B TaxID=2839662 RepID=A0A951PFJ5_9CYAN|nr:hypothetical protein [Pegethrix bostrychoides GSE-TBD4-15B]